MSVVQTVSTAAVLRALPTGIARRFDPGAAGELDATIELRVADARFAVRVVDRRCSVERRAAPEAGARVTISAGDIARLVTGAAQWPVLLAAKRLELDGDPFLALRFPKLFRFGTPSPVC
jgi:hypothetical protein